MTTTTIGKINSVNTSQHTPYVLTPVFEAVAKAFEVVASNLDVAEKAVKAKAKKDLSNLKEQGKVTKTSFSLVSDFPTHKVTTLADHYAFFVEHEKVYVQYKIDDKGREYAIGPFSHFEPCVLLPMMECEDECFSKLKKAKLVEDYDAAHITQQEIPSKFLKAAQAIKNGDAKAVKTFVNKELIELADGNTVVKFTFKPSAMVAALVVSELQSAE